jgi:hypothetical protein
LSVNFTEENYTYTLLANSKSMQHLPRKAYILPELMHYTIITAKMKLTSLSVSLTVHFSANTAM